MEEAAGRMLYETLEWSAYTSGKDSASTQMAINMGTVVMGYWWDQFIFLVQLSFSFVSKGLANIFSAIHQSAVCDE